MDYSTADDKFRFYLCVERNRSNFYECAQVSMNEAIKEAAENYRSVVVPVNKRLPKFVDYIYINNALKPTFYVHTK